MRTCIHTYTYIHTHACMHAYIHAYMHAYIHTHTYIRCKPAESTRTSEAYTYTCMYHTCIHAYIHTYIYTYTYGVSRSESTRISDAQLKALLEARADRVFQGSRDSEGRKLPIASLVMKVYNIYYIYTYVYIHTHTCTYPIPPPPSPLSHTHIVFIYMYVGVSRGPIRMGGLIRT